MNAADLRTDALTPVCAAVLLPLDTTDCGFGWGSDRQHLLIDELSLDDVRQQYPALTDHDIAIVDLRDGIDDSWPSAGHADSWSDDVWLGLADYLSFLAWQMLLPEEYRNLCAYTLTAEDAALSVANSGADAVSRAVEYLADDDKIGGQLSAALAKAEGKDQ